jgi:hypothetical protein
LAFVVAPHLTGVGHNGRGLTGSSEHGVLNANAGYRFKR